MPELTGAQIDELTEIELDLWKADQACQDEVGYAEFTASRSRTSSIGSSASSPSCGS